MKFSTIEEALEDLRQGRSSLSRTMRTGKMRGISSVPQNLQIRRTLISWRSMERV